MPKITERWLLFKYIGESLRGGTPPKPAFENSQNHNFVGKFQWNCLFSSLPFLP